MSATPDSDSQRLIDLAQLTASEFEPMVGQSFAVDLDYAGMASDASPIRRSDVYPAGQDVSLELIQVARRPAHPDPSLREPFSLLFCGSDQVPLYSVVHVLEHSTLGRMAVLLSAVQVMPSLVAEHPSSRFYECVMG